MTHQPINTLIIAYNDAQLLDIAGPYQVFASANDELENPAYDLTLADLDDGGVTTSSGLMLRSTPLDTLDPQHFDMVVVVGGKRNAVRSASANADVRRWLRTFYESRAKRLCSVCSGTFVLAAAGVMDGKRVATHWQGTALLQKLYPDLEVDADAIYVRDGNIWSSAGVTTGIDMCLAIVAEDLGSNISLAVARRLVLYTHRPGHQTQFSTLLDMQDKVEGPLAATLHWMRENRQNPMSVNDCATHAGMSERTFHRRFQAATGSSPARYLESLRIDAARSLLQESDAPLKQIASLSGFSSDQHLILVFEKRLGLSPTDYRKLHGNRPLPQPANM